MSDAPTVEPLVVLDPEHAGRAEAAAGQADEAAIVASEAAAVAVETVAAAEAVAAEAALDARAEAIAEHEGTEQWQTVAIGELTTAVSLLAEQQNQMMRLLQTLAPLPEAEPSPQIPPASSPPPTAESQNEDARPAPPEPPKRRRLRLL
jgi:hypothetical protein